MRIAAFVAPLLAGLLLPLSPLLSQTALRYAFPAGSEYRYRKIDTTIAQVTGPGGLEENIDRKSETLLRIEGNGAPAGQVSYLYKQDTVYVDEKRNEQVGFRLSDLNNALNGKRIRVRMTDHGEFRGIDMLDSIVWSSSAPVQLTDTMLAQQALLFPALPDRPVAPGQSWTDARVDTLRPRFAIAGSGESRGFTIQKSSTTYRVTGEVRRGERRCLAIGWHSTIKRESEMTAGEMELYNEEDTGVIGTLLFDAAAGLLVEYESRTTSDATNVVVSGGENTQMPSTTTSTTKLILLPSR